MYWCIVLIGCLQHIWTVDNIKQISWIYDDLMEKEIRCWPIHRAYVRLILWCLIFTLHRNIYIYIYLHYSSSPAYTTNAFLTYILSVVHCERRSLPQIKHIQCIFIKSQGMRFLPIDWQNPAWRVNKSGKRQILVKYDM